MNRRNFTRLAAANIAVAAFTFGLAPLAQADTYPSKPIKLVVPYSPGGLPDTVARVLSRYLPDALGQPVVVENKPGAGGAVAAATLAAVATRRLHPAGDGRADAVDHAVAYQEDDVRRGERFRARFAGREGTAVPGGQPEREGQYAR